MQYDEIDATRVVLMVNKIASLLTQANEVPDVILAVSDGGNVPARLLRDIFEVKDIRYLKISKYDVKGNIINKDPKLIGVGAGLDLYHNMLQQPKVLIVDDVIETGDTIKMALKYARSLSKDIMVCALVKKSDIGNTIEECSVLVSETFKSSIWCLFPWEKNVRTGSIKT